MRTVLTDLQIHHVNNCIQLSSLRCTTISNTVMCTLHDFLSSIFIRALLLDHILALEKKLRVRLAYASRTTCYTEAHFDTSTSIPGHYKFQAILSLISSPKPRQKAIITHMQWLTIISQKLRIHVICLQHNDLYGLT